MFGRSNSDYRQREMEAGARIAAAFELFREEAPAAAYLFARTLVNARSLVDDTTKSRSEKIRAIQAEINTLKEGSNLDAGTTELALRFVCRLLSVADRDDVASYGHSAAFGEIAKFGERYRGLGPRDFHPPNDEGSRSILAKQGRTCVGQVVDALMTECAERNGDQHRAEEDTAAILALFDLREEVGSGQLQTVLPALKAAIRAE